MHLSFRTRMFLLRLVLLLSLLMFLLFNIGRGWNPFTGVGKYYKDCTILSVVENYTDTVKVHYTIDDFRITDYAMLPISQLPVGLPTTVVCKLKDDTMDIGNPNDLLKVELWIGFWSLSFILLFIAHEYLKGKEDDEDQKVDSYDVAKEVKDEGEKIV